MQPSHFDSLHLVGIIHAQQGNYVESVRQIDLALKINPKAASAHEAFNNRGNALQELKRFDDALVAGSTSRLSCKRAGTTRTLMPVCD